MIDGLDIGSEFNNYGFDTNIANFVNYHTKASDTSYTEKSHISSSNLNSARSTTPNPTTKYPNRRFSCIENAPEAIEVSPPVGKNFSMTCIDKGLTSIPHEIMQKHHLLTVLDLSRNRFEHFPMEILLIKPLRVLKIDHNKIKYIPSDIVKLQNLEAFSLSHNLVQRLPPNLCELPRLVDLNLESNVIDTFNKEVNGLRGLKTLNLLQNKLTILPCSFRELTGLSEFYFEWFKYSNPPLSQCQRGKEGELIMKKLKNKLNELYHKDIKGLNFQEFINLFSTHPVNFRSINKQNQTILHLAALNEDLSVMRFLIRDHHELLESLDDEGVSPLCLSLLKDKGKAAYYLIKNGANALSSGCYQGNPIHIAAKRLNFGALKDIIKEGENPNRIDAKGNTALHYATMLMVEGYNKAIPMIQYLLEQGANPNAKNKENWAPVHIVARKKDSKALDWMLSYNFEVQEIHGRDEFFNLNSKGGGYKWTPMHIAAYADTPDLVTSLGEADVNVFKKSANGYTPKMVIKKNGLTLKLMEKYERDWIKANVLSKKDNQQESLTPVNLRNLDSTKEIKNASKNKFGETSFYEKQYSLEPSASKARLEFFAPLMGSGIIFKRKGSDQEPSFEISPESESNSSLEDTDVLKETIMNETNENIRIETSTYTSEQPFDGKTNTTILQQKVQNANRTLKERNAVSLYQTLDLDIQSRYNRLKTLHKFNLEACSKEVSHAKEMVTSEKTSFNDKVKLIFGLKALYFQIVDHVYATFYGLGDKESFPWYILQESVKRAKDFEYYKMHKSAILEIIAYYEVVPQGLISVFIKLDNLSYESQLLKMFICGILADMKYFPAIDFLQNIMETPVESYMTIREARRTHNYLRTILKAKSIEMKENALGRKMARIKTNRVLQSKTLNVD